MSRFSNLVQYPLRNLCLLSHYVRKFVCKFRIKAVLRLGLLEILGITSFFGANSLNVSKDETIYVSSVVPANKYATVGGYFDLHKLISNNDIKALKFIACISDFKKYG